MKELNKEDTVALSHVSDAADNASRSVLKALMKVKNIHPSIYNNAQQIIKKDEIKKEETYAKNAFRVASDKTWNLIVAAKKTYKPGNAMTNKKQEALQTSYTLQKFMSEITTNMDTFMKTSDMSMKPGLLYELKEKVIKAKVMSDFAQRYWKELLKTPLQEAGGRKRNTLRKKNSRINYKSKSRKS